MTNSNSSSRGLAFLFVGVIAVAVGLCFAYVFWLEPRLRQTRENPEANAHGGIPPGMTPTPFIMPPIIRPPTRSIAAADLPDETEIIGISAGGRHRAYVVDALAGPARHVVNDVLGDVPVSVTHCDRTDCSRAFTGSGKGAPLDLRLSGWWFDNQMLLQTPEGVYAQGTGQPTSADVMPPFPYPDAPFVRVTWGAWKMAHPDTDLYAGDLPD
jgi:hypothetical protein